MSRFTLLAVFLTVSTWFCPGGDATSARDVKFEQDSHTQEKLLELELKVNSMGTAVDTVKGMVGTNTFAIQTFAEIMAARHTDPSRLAVFLSQQQNTITMLENVMASMQEQMKIQTKAMEDMASLLSKKIQDDKTTFESFSTRVRHVEEEDEIVKKRTSNLESIVGNFKEELTTQTEAIKNVAEILTTKKHGSSRLETLVHQHQVLESQQKNLELQQQQTQNQQQILHKETKNDFHSLNGAINRNYDLLQNTLKRNDNLVIELGRLSTIEKYRSSRSLSNDYTTIMRSACEAGDVEALTALLDLGLDTERNLLNDGETCLSIAASRNHLKLAEILMARGCNKNARRTNQKGDTPLIRAVYHKHLDMVKMLVEHGADLNVKDNQWNTTPMGWARDNSSQEVINYLKSKGAPG